MLRGFLVDSERALTVMVTGAVALMVVGFVVAVAAIMACR